MKKASVIFFIFSVLFNALLSAQDRTAQNVLHVPSVNESFVITNPDGSEFIEEDLSGSEIIAFSMYFGLCDSSSSEFKSAVSSYNELRKFCIESGIENLNEEERGEAILNAMYSRVLSQYRLNQTKVDAALNSGVYNCVSSALLYLALASDFKLDARVQETAKHAFISLYLSDGKKIDVETTNPYGFNPGVQRAVSGSSNKYAVVPRSYYSNQKEVSKRRAVTLVAKNLCADFNNRDDYVSAVPLAASVLTFVTKEKTDAREDFDTVAGNFAVYADKRKAPEAGLDFLDEVFARYGKTESLLGNYNDVAYNSAANSCNSNSFDEARANFEKRKSNLTVKNTADIEKMIFQSETIHTAQSLEADEGIEYVQQARNSDFARSDSSFKRNLEKLEESLWANKVINLFNAGQYIEAASVCDDGLLSLPQNSYLRNTKNTCLQNHSVDVHNRVVTLVRSNDLDNAKKILEDGLKVNPSSRTLQNDLKLLQK